ncbi:MAG: archaemetzincin family Zn-dependent metalloprotease [Candidatus Bathyarchaeia archaeon]
MLGMKIYIIGFEGVGREALESIRIGVEEVIGRGACKVQNETLRLPVEAYNSLRRQYLSEPLLEEIYKCALKIRSESGIKCIVLGVTDVDIYAPGMNFIFGMAQCPGRAAIISLFRLRPEFYGESPDPNLFLERAVKEAIHEIGHALGLKHCKKQSCVMFFSLHIGITDRKSKFFCDDCMRKIRCVSWQ